MGTVAFEYARMAADANILTTVFTPYYESIPDIAQKREHQFGFVVQRLKPWFAIGNAAFLPQLFWKLRAFSIIHIHYPCIGLELPVLLWRCVGRLVVVTYHFDLAGKSWLRRTLFSMYARITVPLVMAAAHTVFVTSFDYAKHSPVLSRYIQRYAKKFVELPNSVDTSMYRPHAGGPSPARTNGVSSFADVILFVGGLDRAHYFKGVTVLLDASRLVIEERPSAFFVFVGDGDMRKEYEEYATTHGVANATYFAGSASRDELPAWYRRATCVVLPSVDSTEAFGVVLIEAGACAKPVIATHLPGVRSVIQDGVTGYLVKPNSSRDLAEKICALLEHPDRAREMGQAGYRRVAQRYSYEGVARKYREHINNLFHT